MKKLMTSIGGMFKDNNGNTSSKRVIGILCGVSLCITLYVNSYSHGDIKPSDTLVNAVAMLAFGCLGLTSTEKIFGKKSSDKNSDTQSAE
jgi:ABC-type transport system involved in cytochrome c biogenesis permease subunit